MLQINAFLFLEYPTHQLILYSVLYFFLTNRLVVVDVFPSQKDKETNTRVHEYTGGTLVALPRSGHPEYHGQHNTRATMVRQ